MAIAGPLTSVVAFSIDHMNAGLWWLMGAGIVASLVLGVALMRMGAEA